jgi:hypothetical protein
VLFEQTLIILTPVGTQARDRLCPGINARIIVEEDSDRDTPLIFVQGIDAHYVANLFAMYWVVGPKVQRYDDVHPDEVVLGERYEIQSAARYVRGCADFFRKQRIARSNTDGLGQCFPGG